MTCNLDIPALMSSSYPGLSNTFRWEYSRVPPSRIVRAETGRGDTKNFQRVARRRGGGGSQGDCLSEWTRWKLMDKTARWRAAGKGEGQEMAGEYLHFQLCPPPLPSPPLRLPQHQRRHWVLLGFQPEPLYWNSLFPCSPPRAGGSPHSCQSGLFCSRRPLPSLLA